MAHDVEHPPLRARLGDRARDAGERGGLVEAEAGDVDDLGLVAQREPRVASVRVSCRPHPTGDPPMKYRLLGNSGLRVSELALGAMTFGMPGWGVEKDESRRVYDGFREAGGNFIDTANLYSGGRSETFLGEFLADERERIVLATKYTGATRS